MTFVTVKQNLEMEGYGFLFNKKQIEEQINQILGYFPGLVPHLKRKGGVLSGGQQQLLAIARALVSNPQLLILDEPTEGIQPNLTIEIGDILNRINKELGITLIIVEQNIEFINKVSEKYVIMEKGKIVEGGCMSELKNDTIRKYLTV